MSLSSKAQKPELYLNFNQILDNREYFTDYARHQTFFGARFNPGVAFSFDSVHQVVGGINYMYEFDGALLCVTPQIDLSDRIQLDRLNFASRLDMKYKIFGIKGVYYRGGASPLLYGDRLYSSGNYGRVDLFVDPFKNPRISSKIGWNFHILPGDGLYFSQQILIHVRL